MEMWRALGLSETSLVPGCQPDVTPCSVTHWNNQIFILAGTSEETRSAYLQGLLHPGDFSPCQQLIICCWHTHTQQAGRGAALWVWTQVSKKSQWARMFVRGWATRVPNTLQWLKRGNQIRGKTRRKRRQSEEQKKPEHLVLASCLCKWKAAHETKYTEKLLGAGRCASSFVKCEILSPWTQHRT